jgi:hypothetical protein
MTATTPSTALAAIQPAFTDAERLALAGFLAGYRGLTREACTSGLRQFTGWCRAHWPPPGRNSPATARPHRSAGPGSAPEPLLGTAARTVTAIA